MSVAAGRTMVYHVEVLRMSEMSNWEVRIDDGDGSFGWGASAVVGTLVRQSYSAVWCQFSAVGGGQVPLQWVCSGVQQLGSAVIEGWRDLQVLFPPSQSQPQH